MKALLIFLVLLMIGGGTLVYNVRKQNREARYEALVLHGHRTAVVANHEAIARTAVACQRIAESADRLTSPLSILVAETLKIEAMPIAGAPAPSPAVVEPAAAEAENTGRPIGIMDRAEIERRRQRERSAGQGENADRPEAPVMPPPTVPERRRIEQPEDEGKPEGILSLKELEARRARGGRGEPPPAPAEVKPPVRSEEAPPPRPPVKPQPAPAAGKEDRPVQVLARQVEGHIAKTRENAQAAIAAEFDARALREEVMTVRTTAAAAASAAAILPLVAATSTLEADSATELDLARKAMLPVENEKKRVQDAYQAKLEEARRRKDEMALKALKAGEVAAAAELKKLLATMIRQYKFADGLDRATVEMAQCKTEEGKVAYRPLVERCTRLKALKDFLIARIKAKPYHWGWGDPGNARDIVSADESGIKHTTAAVAWPDISVKQLSRIVDYCILDTSLGVKEMGEYHLGAAVLFKDLGAAEISEIHRAKAIQSTQYLEEEAVRLLQ